MYKEGEETLLDEIVYKNLYFVLQLAVARMYTIQSEST